MWKGTLSAQTALLRNELECEATCENLRALKTQAITLRGFTAGEMDRCRQLNVLVKNSRNLAKALLGYLQALQFASQRVEHIIRTLDGQIEAMKGLQLLKATQTRVRFQQDLGTHCDGLEHELDLQQQAIDKAKAVLQQAAAAEKAARGAAPTRQPTNPPTPPSPARPPSGPHGH